MPRGHRKDTWPKRRSHGQHFTWKEADYVRDQYRKGRKPIDVARVLRCAVRSIQIRFALMAAEGLPQDLKSPAPRKSAPHPSGRFYTSDFVPS